MNAPSPAPIGTAASLAATPRLQDADLELMLVIRLFERRLLALFAANQLGGTTHTCIGQEYVPVAVSRLLGDGDFVFSNHRGHGHYLARFRDPYGLVCEITGKADGVCKGVGGSQHIGRDRYFSTGVQGESVPLACGTALAAKAKGAGALSLAYIGDGTWGEGAVYEGLNMAALWELPIVLVVENNRIAQTTPIARNMAGDVRGRAAAFGVEFVSFTGWDVDAICEALAPRFEAVRRAHRPLVVEFHTTRLGPHSKGDDTRPADELRANELQDWGQCTQVAHPAQYARAHAAAERAIDESFARMQSCPLSGWEPGR